MYNSNAVIEIRFDILSDDKLNDPDKILWGCIYTFQKMAALKDAISRRLLHSITDYDFETIDESLKKMLSLNLIKSKYEENLEETIYEVI